MHFLRGSVASFSSTKTLWERVSKAKKWCGCFDRAGFIFIAFIVITISPFKSSAAKLPVGFVEEVIVETFDAATALAVTPDGRVLLCNQGGKLFLVKDDTLIPDPILTLEVDDYWERGLIGIALDPDFPEAPHIFITYVAAKPYTHHRISRFTMTGDSIDPASELILLKGDDQGTMGGHVPHGHQGGIMIFGPDGKLYVGLGEQTAGKPAQSIDTLLGKILRINPDGSIPKDNPFYNQTHGKYRSIWAIGIRNPFGMDFQPGTGQFYVNDVGQTSFEEINIIVKGGNYGWPMAEGKSDNPKFINPIHAYPPAIGRSITGGLFYNPKTTQFPMEYVGKYFFLDWAANWLKILDPDTGAVSNFGKNFSKPVALQLAPDGSLYVLNRATIWNDRKKYKPNRGSLVRIRYQESENAVQPKPFPRLLSETKVFLDIPKRIVADGFMAFEMNAPIWTPGVIAKRWIYIPDGKKIGFSVENDWRFPEGTRIVQHFTSLVSRKPLETHVYTAGGGEDIYFRAAAYRWNKKHTDARLVENSEIISIPGDEFRFWFSPGYEFWLNTDFSIIGFVLQMNTRQLNRYVVQPHLDMTVNQLEVWYKKKFFDRTFDITQIDSYPRLASLNDPQATAEHKVRSYLDSNCAVCHRPGGASRGFFDARYSTKLEDQLLLNGELMAGDMGILGSKLVVPGNVEKSVLYERIARQDAFKMPPTAFNPDLSPVLPALKTWIRSLKNSKDAP